MTPLILAPFVYMKCPGMICSRVPVWEFSAACAEIGLTTASVANAKTLNRSKNAKVTADLGNIVSSCREPSYPRSSRRSYGRDDAIISHPRR
jgi:hypothetical protein